MSSVKAGAEKLTKEFKYFPEVFSGKYKLKIENKREFKPKRSVPLAALEPINRELDKLERK